MKCSPGGDTPGKIRDKICDREAVCSVDFMQGGEKKRYLCREHLTERIKLYSDVYIFGDKDKARRTRKITFFNKVDEVILSLEGIQLSSNIKLENTEKTEVAT